MKATDEEVAAAIASTGATLEAIRTLARQYDMPASEIGLVAEIYCDQLSCLVQERAQLMSQERSRKIREIRANQTDGVDVRAARRLSRMGVAGSFSDFDPLEIDPLEDMSDAEIDKIHSGLASP